MKSYRCYDIFLYLLPSLTRAYFQYVILFIFSLASFVTLISKTYIAPSGRFERRESDGDRIQTFIRNWWFNLILNFWNLSGSGGNGCNQVLEKSCYKVTIRESPSAKLFSKPHWSKLLTGKCQNDQPWCLQTSPNISFRSAHCSQPAG